MRNTDTLTAAVILARESTQPTFQFLDAFARLLRASRAYARLCELQCSQPLTERQEKRLKRLPAQIAALAREMGFGVTLQQDPRGYCVKVVVPSGASNTLGNDGWGIA